jgi:hypothetical protein
MQKALFSNTKIIVCLEKYEESEHSDEDNNSVSDGRAVKSSHDTGYLKGPTLIVVS